MRTVVYAYQNTCVTSQLLTLLLQWCYWLRKQKQDAAEQQTQSNK